MKVWYNFSAVCGGAAFTKLGRFPLRESPASVNWLTAKISPLMSMTERFIL